MACSVGDYWGWVSGGCEVYSVKTGNLHKFYLFTCLYSSILVLGSLHIRGAYY